MVEFDYKQGKNVIMAVDYVRMTWEKKASETEETEEGSQSGGIRIVGQS